LQEFNAEAERELSKEVKEGDYEGLLKVMSYLGMIRERRQATDNMFDPIKDIIELLKTYDVEFPEEIYVQLQVNLHGIRFGLRIYALFQPIYEFY